MQRFLSWLADRLVLDPSTDPIDAAPRQRQVVESSVGSFELWSLFRPADRESARSLVILKFPGSGGRAERVREHPAECWPDVQATIHAVNPPGYGGSLGRARLANIAAVAEASWQFVRARHLGEPLLVVGNSLGCLAALLVAARFEVSGLYLRNPAPVHQLIRRRWKYNWWNLGLARWIANQIPLELDAYRNAALSKVPCLLVTSERDQLVPRIFQDELAAIYGGTLRQFVVAGAAHHDSIPDEQRPHYLTALKWLAAQIF